MERIHQIIREEIANTVSELEEEKKKKKKKKKSTPYNLGVRGPVMRTPSGFVMYHMGGIAESEEDEE